MNHIVIAMLSMLPLGVSGILLGYLLYTKGNASLYVWIYALTSIWIIFTYIVLKPKTPKGVLREAIEAICILGMLIITFGSLLGYSFDNMLDPTKIRFLIGLTILILVGFNFGPFISVVLHFIGDFSFKFAGWEPKDLAANAQ